MTEPRQLAALPEDWDRALAVVAHPDDLEYGAASAIARWTSQGKQVHYLLVTRGEAGMNDMPPEEVGPLREIEERRSAAVVGVHCRVSGLSRRCRHVRTPPTAGHCACYTAASSRDGYYPTV